ncbi:MAG: LAGLIDADG family homing endonuclease [Patescibacteria group bacterium]
MGSRSKTNLAYIAGFLDGDGSLMLQIKKRKDGKLKRRFMFTICFYQDSRHEKPLYWIRDILGIGYISKRNDGITELRINGYKQSNRILGKLIPFIRFKKGQAKAMYKATSILSRKEDGKLTKKDLYKLIDYILTIQKSNYITKRKKTKKDLLKILDLTP